MADRTCSREGCGRVEQLRRGLCRKHWWQVLLSERGACKWEGCDRTWAAAGYCQKHYAHFRSFGEPGAESVIPLRGACTASPECDEPIKAQGYCENHYFHWRQDGDPLYMRPPSPPPIIRKHALDETYFDEITDERRAYWLGFITADGNVRHEPGTYVLQIALAAKDRTHLEILRDALGSTVPVRINGLKQGYLAVNSRYLVESLMRLGVTPCKSATAKPWAGPEHLMRHYWRGLFDGDGSIGRCNNKQSDHAWFTSQTGSLACVTEFSEWAKRITGSRAKIHWTRGSKKTKDAAGCWVWGCGGSRKPQLLATALYEDATVALERKMLRAQQLMAVDLDAYHAEVNRRRSATMRARWASPQNPWGRLAA